MNEKRLQFSVVLMMSNAFWSGAAPPLIQVYLFTGLYLNANDVYHKKNHATRPRSEWGQGALPICDCLWFGFG